MIFNRLDQGVVVGTIKEVKHTPTVSGDSCCIFPKLGARQNYIIFDDYTSLKGLISMTF